MMDSIIDQLKKNLIEDITIIEQTRIAKQNIIYSNKIYIESSDDRRSRELAEEIERKQMREFSEVKKEYEKLMQETMEKIKKEREEWIKELRSKNKS